MATTGQLVELLAGSDDLESDGFVRGQWVQNLWFRGDMLTARAGFGQFSQLDSTLSLASGTPQIGYKEHLGSIAFRTTFGHEQILSVFYGSSAVSNISDSATQGPQVYNLIFVRISDLTTGSNFEEVLYKQTQEMEDSLDPRSYTLRDWLGNYETTYDQDNRKFISSDRQDFFFANYDGYIYFGNPRVGVCAYRPANFLKERKQWLSLSERTDWYDGYSESSIITKLSLTKGNFSGGHRYLKNSEIGKIVDITQTSTGRTVFASGRELYFSDPYSPASIIATNYVTIPLKNPITAVHSLQSSILVFSQDETYLYQPNVGSALASGGRVTQVSKNVGCLSSSAVTSMMEGVVWVSTSGVHLTHNGTAIKNISDGIHNFFKGGVGNVTNPLTSFFETLGTDPGSPASFIPLSSNDNENQHPRTLIISNKKRVNVSFEEETGALFISFPDINSLWVFKDGWTFWPLESCVKLTGVGAPEVGAQQNLTNPWVMTLAGEVYLAIGIDVQSFTDSGEGGFIRGSVDKHDVTTGSCALLRLGLGGAIDRSTTDEDYRIGAQQYYYASTTVTDDGTFYIREPVFDETDSNYWVPLEMVRTSGATGLSQYRIRFQFDTTQWAPVAVGSTLTVRFPSERKATSAGVTSIRCTAAGIPDATGNHIQIEFNGAALPAGFQDLNVSARGLNRLVEFKMSPVGDTSKVGFCIRPDTPNCHQTISGAGAAVTSSVIVFGQTFFKSTDLNYNDKKAQPVDWAFQSSAQGRTTGQIRARGLYADIVSHGTTDATSSPLSPGWLWGAYNVLIGSDEKPFSSQIVDISEAEINPNIKKIVNKMSIRNRFRAATAMAERAFNKGALWGSSTNPSDGNYLVDDQQRDTIATSDSVKGQTIRYMVFGFLRGRAERFSIGSLVANLRPAGSRRRTGR